MSGIRSGVQWSRPARFLMRLEILAMSAAVAQVDTEQIDVEIVRADPIEVPADFTMRVRLTAITPDEPTVIRWRYGGEGQGGDVIRGVFPQARSPGRCGGRSPSAADRRVVRPAAGRVPGPTISQEAVSDRHRGQSRPSGRSRNAPARRILDRRGVPVRVHLPGQGREDVRRQRTGRGNGHDPDSRLSARRRNETGSPPRSWTN